MYASPLAETWNNRALFRLMWPLVLEQFLAVTMGVADTLMVSSSGEFAVSGVNIVDNINNLLIMVLLSLATGGAVVVSQYIGRHDNANASLASRQLIYIVSIISVFITVMALSFRAPIIRLLYGSLDDDVMGAAMIYFFLTALSYPMMGLYNSCAALFRATGNSKAPMRIALITNILKIGLNALFIYVFRMGVAGAALSTLLTRITGGVIILLQLIHDERIPISLSGVFQVKFEFSMLKRILNIGIPAGLENSMFHFGRLLTQRIFPFFGTSMIAANAVAGTINSLAFMIGNAYCIGLITIVGQSIGAGNYEAAKRYTTKVVKISWITVFIVSTFIFIFKNTLVGLFNLSPEAHTMAMSFLNVHCVSMILGWTFSFAFPAALRAAGDAKFIMLVGTVSMWLVRVCCAYLITFVFNLGPMGVWLAMGMDFIVRGICFYKRWKGGKWQKLKVISD